MNVFDSLVSGSVSNIGFISYCTSGILFAVLAALLLTSWHPSNTQKQYTRKTAISGHDSASGLRSQWLIAALVFNALWSFAFAYQASRSLFDFSSVFIVESLRYLFWIIFLIGLIRVADQAFYKIIKIVLLGLVVAGVVTSVWLWWQPRVPDQPMPTVATTVLLVLMMTVLVLVEQLFRNLNSASRWAVKFLCFGLAALALYDIYVYSYGLLYKTVTLEAWNARGVVNAVIVPLLAVSIARDPGWSNRLFVSRQVVFYTASLFTVGLYMVLIALGGYVIRSYGGTWATLLQNVFIFGSLLLLALIVTSGRFRLSLKLLLTRHFFSNKYDYRDEWLQLIYRLTTTQQLGSLPQRCVQSLSDIVQARGGAVWYGQDHFKLLGCWEMSPPADLVANDDFIQWLAEKRWVVNLKAPSSEQQMMFSPFLQASTQPSDQPDEKPAWLANIHDAWLVIPLVHLDELVGFIVLEHGDYISEINWEDFDLLRTAGQQIASYLKLDDVGNKLLVAKQFEAYNKLTTFVIHDLKNIIAQQQLLVQNAKINADNPEFVTDAFQTIEHSVKRMQRLMGQLQSGQAATELHPVSIKQLLQTIDKDNRRQPVPILNIRTDVIIYTDAEQLRTALEHLISNAQDACAMVPEREHAIQINVYHTADKVTLQVSDTGCGMTAEFIQQRLFKPFESTKADKGMGIGMYEVREFIHQLQGSIQVDSQPGEGTVMTICLPREQAARPASTPSAVITHSATPWVRQVCHG